MLKTNVVWPESRRFKSRTEWEPIGFFSEALCNATQFDIKLGFFSSSAINVLSDGFATFLYNGGRMRMVINDILSINDRDAIMAGEEDAMIPFFDLQNIRLSLLIQQCGRRMPQFVRRVSIGIKSGHQKLFIQHLLYAANTESAIFLTYK